MKSFTVYAVIVTYGERFNYLKEVVSSVLKQNVKKVIIVDNNSNTKSKSRLKTFEKKNPERVKVIYLEENTGSACGYKEGIMQAIQIKSCQYIWLLDDDNKPEGNALFELKQAWESIDEVFKAKSVCLASFRETRDVYKRAVLSGKPEIVLGRKNTFRAFHSIDAINSLFRKIFPADHQADTNEIGEIYAAPYGGMFFHKELIGLIGYPDENFYLYVDDHEFSHRVIKKHGKIYLVPGSIIHDIDKSWHVQHKGFAISKMAQDTNYLRLYYSVRNRAYFEKLNLVSNWLVYSFHLVVYSSLVFFIALINFRFKNIKVFLTALYDGLAGRLGINKKYKLN